MIDKEDLDFKVTYAEHKPGSSPTDLEAKDDIPPINLCIAQTQLKFLMELLEDHTKCLWDWSR